MFKEARTVTRDAGWEKTPWKIFRLPFEKRVGQNLKLLDIAEKILATLRKLLVPLVVPSWLRA